MKFLGQGLRKDSELWIFGEFELCGSPLSEQSWAENGVSSGPVHYLFIRFMLHCKWEHSWSPMRIQQVLMLLEILLKDLKHGLAS